MFRMIGQLASSARAVLAHAPTNRLVRRLRAHGGPGSAVIAVTVGAAYLFAAAVCTVLLDGGGPRWLNLFVALFIWNAFKLLVTGPVILVAHAKRRSARRRSPQQLASYAHQDGGDVVPLRPGSGSVDRWP